MINDGRKGGRKARYFIRRFKQAIEFGRRFIRFGNRRGEPEIRAVLFETIERIQIRFGIIYLISVKPIGQIVGADKFREKAKAKSFLRRNICPDNRFGGCRNILSNKRSFGCL